MFKMDKYLSAHLLLIGIFLIGTALIPLIFFRGHPEYEWVVFISSLLSNAGTALIIIDLIEKRHLKRELDDVSKNIVDTSSLRLATALNNVSKNIVHDSSQQFNAKFEETFDIIQQKQFNGLRSMLPPRRHEDKGDVTETTIASELKESRTICILGISCLDFFGRGPNPGKPFISLTDVIQNSKNNQKPLDLHVRALIIKPDSEAAEFRSSIEVLQEGLPPEIGRDVERTIEGIHFLNTQNGSEFIQYKLYKQHPQVGFVLTDRHVFVEPYHSAPTVQFCSELRKMGLKASTLATGCTGGRIPILQFSAHSNMYVAMKTHFDHLWSISE